MGEPVLAATSPSEIPRMEVGVDDWIDDEESNSTNAKHFLHVWEDENREELYWLRYSTTWFNKVYKLYHVYYDMLDFGNLFVLLPKSN